MTYIHNLDPFAIQISGDLGIRWYGLSYLAGFLAGYWVITLLAKKKISPIKVENVADFITYVALGAMVGGRLGYALFYSPELFIDFRADLPFWGLLAVNEGGMASHGGMIGIVAASIIFGRRFGVDPFHLFDLVVLTGPFGVFFGRIANFINAELLGRPASAEAWFKVKYPTEILSWTTSKKMALADVVPTVGVPTSQWKSWLSSIASSRSQVDQTIQNILNGVASGRQDIIAALEPHLIARHPSQLYAAMSEGVLVFLVLWFLWRRPQKPGVIGASFLIVYGCARIFNELFRMPDAHIGFQLFGMTRGQWLSAAMLVIGALLVFLWRKRDVKAIGGWGR